MIGMAVDLVERYPEARAVFEEGSAALRQDILAVCRDGPEEELHSTRISQPAIFLHSMAVLRVLEKMMGGPIHKEIPVHATAGLSLGEYSALVFAGSLSFPEALRLVGLRGGFMQEACDEAKGAMASVLGLPAEKVEEVVRAASSRGLEVSVANYNSPEQTVISGAVAALEDITPRLEEAGARRVVRLKVAGAYHSEFMDSASKKLAPHLARASIRKPEVPFYSNVTGSRLDDPEAIRAGLVEQVAKPVRWKHILLSLLEGAPPTFVEVGPGRVLQGLLKNVRRDVEGYSAGTCGDLEKVRELLASRVPRTCDELTEA